MVLNIIICVLMAVLLTALLIYVLAFYFSFVRLRMQPTGEDLPDEKQDVWGPFAKEIAAAQDWQSTANVERVTVQSIDGLTLKARFIPTENAVGTALLMHGYRGCAMHDFSYMFDFYRALGFNVLAPDQRAHGTSEGKYITFGIKERFDCRLWVQYLCGRFGEDHPIVMHGISMGASTVMMASELALPDNVRCLVVDCGYTAPVPEFRHVLKRDFHLVYSDPIIFLERFACRLWGHFDFNDASCKEAMKKNTRPTLFFHGAEDHFVPMAMGKENFEACASEKQWIVVEGADHAVSYLTHPELYRQALREFLSKNVAVRSKTE